ncbi:helix-hairpin-helix domain-containing protein [Streptomyces sp. NPDC003247]|uniref:helix-hairpin-helix domain-containing protein n=1 Tax=Streptomyces sp. NPDC003247 TaxID=3364677 RepID=UPI0036A977F6
MALRSRSRTTHPTSGPGREPGSDGRVRLRRPPARGRVRNRHAPAEELRRRAELLFGDRDEERDESGTGPPPEGSGAGFGEQLRAAEDREERSRAGTAPAGVVDRSRARVGEPPAPVETGEGEKGEEGAEGARPVSGPGDRWRRAGLALRERMPVWVQARCGLERGGVLALAVLVVAVAAFAVQHFWTGRTQPVRTPEVVRAAAPYGVRERSGPAEPAASAGAPDGGSSAARTAPEIVVDVSGKVRNPGIHRLPAGSRVVDALTAAGGVRPGTDTGGLNRARFLVDGEQVVVGGPAAGAVPGAAGPGVASGATGGAPAGPVSLNTATVEQLDTLPGVGPVLAQHIVDHRTRHGGFRSVDELRDVNGIGERRFADLRDLVRP